VKISYECKMAEERLAVSDRREEERTMELREERTAG
jgi:hypothetical protein